MPINHPLSLFISSKMQELAEERRVVQTALSSNQMSSWLWDNEAVASPIPIRETSLEEVSDCDIYLGLFWLGYEPSTIEEYQYAQQSGKPCLVYKKQVDEEKRDPQLTAFFEQIERVDNPQGVTVRWFTKPEELAICVREDVLRLLTSVFRHSRLQSANVVNGAIGGTLSVQEQVELTELLLRCTAISNRAQRESVLDLLMPDITQRILRGNTNITDVLQIVKKCVDYEGGIEQLVRATRFIDGNTRSVQAVITFLRAHAFFV